MAFNAIYHSQVRHLFVMNALNYPAHSRTQAIVRLFVRRARAWLPLAAFRRGYLALLLGCFFFWSQPASALDFALDLKALFTTSNQRALALFEAEKFDEAAALFNDKQWKASAYYRARQYQLSINFLENIETAEAHYNRGNALTRQNEIGSAIQAYSEALTLDPDHEDAKYNKALLEKQQQEGEQQKRNPEEQEEDDTRESEEANGGSLRTESGEEEESETAASPSDNQQQSQPEPSEEQSQEEESTAENERDEEQPEKTQAETEAGLENDSENQQTEQQEQPENPDQNEELSEKSVEEWLNKVKDDPGGLLRRKFKYLYNKQQKDDG